MPALPRSAACGLRRSGGLAIVEAEKSQPPDDSDPSATTEDYFKMLTARAMTNAVVDSAIALCTVIRSLAERVRGIVSVGENAVALVKET